MILTRASGIRTTCQFQSKIFDHDGVGKHLFCTDPLDNYGFDEEQTDFFADNVAFSLSEDGTSYTLKSARNENCIVNLTVTRTAPGFVVGTDGTTFYGTDLSNPWGSMRHAFWPRCTVTGTMETLSKTYDMKGRAMYSFALQGMKPHHAAAKWNFINFQTPTYSAILMEFTTPPSYGTTTVVVGGIAKDGEIVYAGSSCSVKHLAASQDTENDWPEPKAILVEWTGKAKDGQEVKADIMGDLGTRADRIDVLAHIPGFVKTIVGGVVGTKVSILSTTIYASTNTYSLISTSTLLRTN
jgi:Svf1-like C-terminal lipocalin-like domain/Svf1-like N-terminal lipocalin domain